ncbi:MAG: YceI family protein [Gammaproteobacteria bacterium]
MTPTSRARAPFILALALSLLAPAAGAAGWRIDPAASQVSFVSVKNGKIGETHRFGSVAGTLGGDGRATLYVNLDSVDTGIDIRNERMRDMLFETKRFARARATARIDPATVTGLEPGARLEHTLDFSLDLHGHTVAMHGEVAVTALDGGRLLVATRAPVIVDAAAFDLGAGVEALREVAKLASISLAVPVTVELVLEPDGD